MKGVYAVLLGFIGWRIISVFLVRTFYVPDEYWQSLEVAHKLTFGYGYLTWEWTAGIRSYIYPGIIAGVYYVMGLLNVECSCMFALVPRLCQAVLTGYSDYCFWRVSKKSYWSMFLIGIAHFWFYTGTRTLINTFEASLTTIAFSYYPWHYEETNFLYIVGLLCYIRPTAIIPWIPLCYFHLENSNFSKFELILKRYIPIGLGFGAIALYADYWLYGDLVITPWNFFKVNVLEGIGGFYGSHPWYWYFVVGFPVVLGITLLPFIASIWSVWKKEHMPTLSIRRKLLASITYTLFILSLLSHKEVRFLLPILPMALYLAAEYLSRVTTKMNNYVAWFLAITLLIGNAIPIWYLGFVHQRGTLDVMPQLAKIAKDYRDESGNRASITFLMPCHSTPYYSHIHQNITMKFLTCEPNFNNVTGYMDEADLFYSNPMGWIEKYIPLYPVDELPSHVVIYDNLEPLIFHFLSIYERISTIPHTEMISDHRIGENVLIFERIKKSVLRDSPAMKPRYQEPKREVPKRDYDEF